MEQEYKCMKCEGVNISEHGLYCKRNKKMWVNDKREAGGGHFETNKEFERRLRTEKFLDRIKNDILPYPKG